MKKVLLVTGLAVCAFNASAQFEQGSLLLSCDFGFNSSTGEMVFENGSNSTTTASPSASDFNFSASGGYFVANKLAVGLGLGYASAGNSKEDDDVVTEVSSGLFVVNPFARYYIPYTDKFAFFAQLDLGFGFGNSKIEQTIGGTTTTQEGSINSLNLGVSPGFTYFVFDNIGLDMRIGFLGYNNMSVSFEDGNTTATTTSNNAGINFGLNTVSFGLSVFL